MAIKTLTQLKSDLASMFETGGANTASEFRSFLTDVLDTLFQGVKPYLYTNLKALSSGDNPIPHGLDRAVYDVYVVDANGYKTIVEIKIVDSNNLVINWSGAMASSLDIYLLVDMD